MGVEIRIVRGDITEIDADAIVNAANAELIHGGGLALYIAMRGGEVINRESRAIGGISVGDAALTSGGNLKARYVIHAATMSLRGNSRATADSIRSSLKRSFELAEEKGCRSIAVPAIGCGIAGFNIRGGARIMRDVINNFDFRNLGSIIFVLHTEGDFKAFREVFKERSS